MQHGHILHTLLRYMYVQQERKRVAYSSSQHVVGKGPQTPPVHTLSMSSLLEDLGSPGVCVWGGDRLAHLVNSLHDVYRHF